MIEIDSKKVLVNKIYSVFLKDTQEVMFFSCLAAIFEVLDSSSIGCGLQMLYNSKVSDGKMFENSKSIITRVEVYGKKKENPGA